MKKVIFCFLLIILSLTLCCCKTELNIKKENGKALKDGTKTYYLNEYDKNDNLLHSTRYTEYEKIIEEFEYNYSYDINGKLYKIRETNLIDKDYIDTNYNKFKQITEKVYYDKNDVIIKKYNYFKNGLIKKEYKYSSGKETGYIISDYYTDNQLKSKTEYSVNGKTKKITTYYKNKLLYQIKDFNEKGLICKITKYSYKNEILQKESIYNADFKLIQVTDYTKNPNEIIKYDEIQEKIPD